VGAWVDGWLDEFAKLPAPKLLVVDELASLNALLQSEKSTRQIAQRLTTTIRQLAQLGNSESQWVWAVSQESNVASLGLNSQSRSSLSGYFLVVDFNLGAADSYLGGNWIQAPDTPLETLCKSSPVGRAVYLTGDARWYPLAAEDALSITGDDRDSRDLLASTQPLPESPAMPLKVESPPNPHDRLEETSQAILEWLGKNGPHKPARISASLTPSRLREPTAKIRARLQYMQGLGLVIESEDVWVTTENPPTD
jgi:hypothetical protein